MFNVTIRDMREVKSFIGKIFIFRIVPEYETLLPYNLSG